MKISIVIEACAYLLKFVQNLYVYKVVDKDWECWRDFSETNYINDVDWLLRVLCISDGKEKVSVLSSDLTMPIIYQVFGWNEENCLKFSNVTNKKRTFTIRLNFETSFLPLWLWMCVNIMGPTCKMNEPSAECASACLVNASFILYFWWKAWHSHTIC